ncbi:MAG: hypothetical protein HC932_03610 [Thermales bacterium]|nr:hypothetical protein [Thermales bacterium]
MKLIKSKIQLDISPKNPIIKDFLDNIPIIKAKRLLKMWSKLDFYSIKYQSKDTV